MLEFTIDPFLEQLASQGDINAIRTIIEKCWDAVSGKPEAECKPISLVHAKWQKQLAVLTGDPDEWYNLSTFLRYRCSDNKGAFESCLKAAELGSIKGMGSVGADYYTGIPGVIAPDQNMARYWWGKEAAAKKTAEIPTHTSTVSHERNNGSTTSKDPVQTFLEKIKKLLKL